ncbi:MAG: DUF2256 and DUF3253 domain-containing protein [Pseudomonadota bacterium]
MGNDPRADKVCAHCGRTFSWRKKWAADWASVRYCSARCRRSPRDDADSALERTIVDLLGQRARGATVCPSEAARAVFAADAWRAQMERTRQAGRRLVAAGELEWLQRGCVVDPDTARGPVRFRLRR